MNAQEKKRLKAEMENETFEALNCNLWPWVHHKSDPQETRDTIAIDCRPGKLNLIKYDQIADLCIWLNQIKLRFEGLTFDDEPANT